MEWPEDVAGELPTPRADDPPELRRRIIAELRDHLQTALQRELLRTGDANQARQNVLVRFGDPARVARKLWFDALWEKIMLQRGMLFALAAMVLVSAASTGLTWFMVVQAGQVNQAMLEQNKAVNESLLARLEALGKATGEPNAASTNWGPLKFRATWDTPSGAPAAGVKIGILGNAYGAETGSQLVRTTGPDGIADFGLVKPGQFLVNAEAPSGELLADTTSLGMGFFEIGGTFLITVLPGQSQTQELVCPSRPQDAEISLAIDWPTETSGQPLWLVCELARQPREVGGHQWASSSPVPQFVVIDSAGTLTNPEIHGLGTGLSRSDSFFPATESSERVSIHVDEEVRYFVKHNKTFVDAPGIYRVVSSQASRYQSQSRDPVYVWLPKATAISRLKWPAGKYTLSRMIVARDAESPDLSLPDDLLHPQFVAAIEFAKSDEPSDKLVYPNEDRARNSQRKRREVKAENPPFEAAADRHNEWRLPIPPRLADILTEPEPVDSDPDNNDSDPSLPSPIPPNPDEPWNESAIGDLPDE